MKQNKKYKQSIAIIKIIKLKNKTKTAIYTFKFEEEKNNTEKNLIFGHFKLLGEKKRKKISL